MGGFRFAGLSGAEHRLTAGAWDYAYHTGTFTPAPGGETMQDRRLYPNRRIILDYLYQPDGSTSFTNNQVRTGQIDWLNSSGQGVDFSDGQVVRNQWRDLEMRQDQDVLKFRVFYVNGSNGFYDAGAVPFDSLAEAPETGHSTNEKLCLVGHVYVVRTCIEGHYAKFIVRSDECAFRTVTPGDSAPIRFAGYGLTIDFRDCDDYGKVYVRQYAGAAPGLLKPALPYYYEITGMEKQVFVADLTFVYRAEDLWTARLSPGNLAVYQSDDAGATWHLLPTQVDPTHAALSVQGVDAGGWFALAVRHETNLAADLDRSGSIDFQDLAVVGEQWRQTQFSGPSAPDLDGNGIVDPPDLALVGKQWLQCEAWYTQE